MEHEKTEGNRVIAFPDIANPMSLCVAFSEFMAGNFHKTVDACSDYLFQANISPETKYTAFFLRGWAQYLNGDAITAVDDFSIWINRETQRDGGNPALGYEFRAACNERLERWELARADYEEVIALDPERHSAAERLELLNRKVFQDTAAQTSLPTLESALDKLAEKDIPSALEICEQIRENSPEERDTDLVIGLSKDLRGRNFSRSGDTAAAQVDYEQAIESYSTFLTEHPDSPLATLGFDRRGQLLLTLGSTDALHAAIEDFSTLIAREQSVMAYLHRGKAYLALAEYPAAVADFNDVLKLDDKNSLALEFNGTVALLNLDTSFAKKSLKKAYRYCENPVGKTRIELMTAATAYLEKNYETALKILRAVESRLQELQTWEQREIQWRLEHLQNWLLPEVSALKTVAVGESKPRLEDLKAACDAIWKQIFNIIQPETVAFASA